MRIPARRWQRALHASAVLSLFAAVVYIYVPPFVHIFDSFGEDTPLSGRMLVAAYPYAFVLPVMAALAGLTCDAESLVPLAYIVAAGLLCFVGLALYVPIVELSYLRGVPFA